MKNVLKKNQLAILVIALMLVTAGYLNYISGDSVETGVEAEEGSEQYAAIRRCYPSKQRGIIRGKRQTKYHKHH